jgi:dTDP-alpha-D-glucuronic acid decarboxylase
VTGPPSRARWVYSTAKSLAEHVVFGLGPHGLRFWIVRPFNPYGPGLDADAFVTATLWRLASGRKPVLIGGGEQTRCFTYVADVVAGIVAALEHPMAQGRAYNIGSTTPWRIADALGVFEAEVLGSERRAHEDRVGSQVFGDGYEETSIRIPQVDAAREFLGWEPKVGLAEGVQATLAWVAENGWWFPESDGPQ